MNKAYINLFKEIARTVELTAEQALELHHKDNDEDGIKAAMTMRTDYANLYDKINSEDFSSNSFNRAEYAKILVGAIIVTQRLENQIKQFEKSVQGYKIDVLPKLQRIMNETNDDDSARALAEEIFQIKEEN